MKKPIYKSKTTAAAGGSAGIITALALVALSLVPPAIREAWGAEGDAAFVAILTTLGTAGLTRLIAWLRGK